MDGILVEAGVVEAGSTDVLNQITFGRRFSVAPVVISAVVSGNQAEEIFVETPVFLADVQGPADLNTPGVRWDEKNLAGVVVTIDLEGEAHSATTPSAPVVGYIAISEM
jgi:hypothetical protein